MTNTTQSKSQLKPTNIPWLGDIPADWEVRRLKYCSEIIMGQSPDSNDYEFEENEYPFLQGNAEFGEKFPVPKLWCKTSNKKCDIGDILLSVRAPVGAINLADKRYGIGRGLCSIKGISIFQDYLVYLLGTSNEELNSIATGSTFTAISIDEVKNLQIPLPPLPTQKAIVEYLDTKTNLISQDRKSVV